MITINNNIKEEPCELFGPDDKSIGIIENDLAFLDVRCQIKKQKLEGYYIFFNGICYAIDINGRVPDYPNDLFPRFLNYLSKLI